MFGMDRDPIRPRKYRRITRRVGRVWGTEADNQMEAGIETSQEPRGSEGADPIAIRGCDFDSVPRVKLRVSADGHHPQVVRAEYLDRRRRRPAHASFSSVRFRAQS
jgi:hypothetical protein